jgi:hypothetical protein
MLSTASRKRATALMAAAIMGTAVVPAASAQQNLRSADARDAAQQAAQQDDDAQVTYRDLRSADARDAARQVPRQDLRSVDTRDAAQGYHPALEPQPVADGPSQPSGLDWVSAALGAAAGTGLLLVVMALAGARRLVGRRPPTAGRQSTHGA